MAKQRRRHFSIASALLIAFATLIVSALAALYLINLRVLQSNLTRELTNYARRHTSSLEVLIQQDLISGFYPAVIQKTARFVDAETIPHIELTLEDGTVIYRGGEPRADLIRIDMPVYANASGLTDTATQRKIANITAWISLKRVYDQIREQQRQALWMWSACLLITLASVALLSKWLSRPIRALTDMAATRNIELLARYQPRSRFKELWHLEGELVALSQQVIKAGAEARLNAQYAAVARTTQMLAHDVRKPFSLLRVGLESIAEEHDGKKLKKAVDMLLPQVRRTMQTVNGMLADIMELKPQQTVVAQAMPLAELVAEAVQVTFQDKVGVFISINYQLHETRDVAVDALRMTRVLVNLIENAVQAMAGTGALWITAADEPPAYGVDSLAMVHLVVGNSGSFIPPDEIEQLFTAFYTRHKAGGTGLGLTIADQIVKAHGGKIWCTSSAERGTEFHLLLPAADGRQKVLRDVAMPCEITRANIVAPVANPPSTAAKDERPLVIVIDDDPFFLEAWCRTMSDAQVVTFAQPEAFLQAWTSSPDLRLLVRAFVLDFHFSQSSMDGGRLARELRRQTSVPIFIASDSVLTMADLPGVTAIIGKDPQPFCSLGEVRPKRDLLT